MKKLYIAVLAVLISGVMLFALSLVYLDREKHKTYYFTVNYDGHDTGNIKVDKFITDDKVIYKSLDTEPFQPLFTESRSRITLDKSGSIMSYSKEAYGLGALDKVYMENTDDKISFVATSGPEFAYLTGIPIKHGTLLFEESSPVTYMPIIERYDFRIGRAQVFNVITSFSTLLPPMKRALTLTSIKDGYMKIGSRTVKVECLLIRIRNSSQGIVWVTKSGKSIVRIEYPDRRLNIVRTFSVKKVNEVNRLMLKNEFCAEENVKFESRKTGLEGTLTIPKKDKPLPAVLLLSQAAGSDREEQGLFTKLAGRLGNEGFVVLRFDRRGTGSGGTDTLSNTDSVQYDDSVAALSFLLSRKEVDPERVAVIGHGKGAYFAAKLASNKLNVKALVLMSPMISLGGETNINFDNLNEMAGKLKWDEQYLKLAMKSRIETIDKVKNTKSDWATLLQTRCFLKKLREEMGANPIDIIRRVDIPVLILHGKEDELVPAKAASTLDKALEDSGNTNHKLIYYGYLGHFFGKLINDGSHRMYYDVDESVILAIIRWLNDSIPKIDLTLPASYDTLPINNK